MVAVPILFRLRKEEFKNLIFHFGTSSWGGTRKFPRAFTEQGVAMLSGGDSEGERRLSARDPKDCGSERACSEALGGIEKGGRPNSKVRTSLDITKDHFLLLLRYFVIIMKNEIAGMVGFPIFANLCPPVDTF